MGGSQSREDLEKCRTQLSQSEAKKKKLADEVQSLQAKLDEQTAALQAQQQTIAEADRAHGEQLSAVSEQLKEAEQLRKLAEDLRTNDALLAKRLMHAQLRHLGGAAPAAPGAVTAVEQAASLALAARDELQLRQMLMHTAGELEGAQAKCAELEASAVKHRRAELTARATPHHTPAGRAPHARPLPRRPPPRGAAREL
jgi:exonuclease SbcC